MSKKWIKLPDYYIILKQDHYEFGYTSKIDPVVSGSILQNGIVMILPDTFQAYQDAQIALERIYYWDNHNSYFSETSKKDECDWLEFQDGYVKSLITE